MLTFTKFLLKCSVKNYFSLWKWRKYETLTEVFAYACKSNATVIQYIEIIGNTWVYFKKVFKLLLSSTSKNFEGLSTFFNLIELTLSRLKTLLNWYQKDSIMKENIEYINKSCVKSNHTHEIILKFKYNLISTIDISVFLILTLIWYHLFCWYFICNSKNININF